MGRQEACEVWDTKATEKEEIPKEPSLTGKEAALDGAVQGLLTTGRRLMF